MAARETPADSAPDTPWRFEGSAVVLAHFPELLRKGVSLAVHPKDEMFTFFFFGHGSDADSAIVLYLSSGADLWSTIRQVIEWRFGALGNVEKLLDFASGFGRVTRFMVSDLSPDRIWISDIYPDAVAFQERELGVHAFVSTPEPSQLVCSEKFDVIVVSSLFTHLSAENFRRWLEKLGSLLAPGGILMFSVHHERLLNQPLPETGILFQEVSESATLPKEQYGTSWVSEEFVRGAIHDAFGDCPIVHIPRGFASYQDLFVVLPDAAEDLPQLELRRQADGFLERSDLVNGRQLQLDGWVIDRINGSPPREVRVRLDGILRGRCTSLSERPDVQRAFTGDQVYGGGFHIVVELENDWSPTSLLTLDVIDGADQELRLYTDSLEAAMLRSARLEVLRCDQKVRHVLDAAQARVAALEEQLHELQQKTRHLHELQQETRHLEQTIAWMQASRFWKLRNRWFGLKRKLRVSR